MSSTDKVLGTIGALNTLIENFPMSIFDLTRGKTYTSAFEFLMDVLYACGVDTNEIISYLLEEIYSIKPNIEGGLENAKEYIAQMDFSQIEQSDFLQTLEDGIKEILKALLISLYGCTAIPVLPNKYMDKPNEKYFEADLWTKKFYPFSDLNIPIKMIDPMGMLELTPTSTDGRIYYDIPGNDVYYRKVKRDSSATFSFKRRAVMINNPILILIENNTLKFSIENEISENINIYLEYLKDNSILKFNTIIKSGNKYSENILNIENIDLIKNITINNRTGGDIIANNNWCYLIKNENEIFSKSIIWGTENSSIILGVDESTSQYYYDPLYDIPEDFKKAKRYNNAPRPEDIIENDPELIVVYEGMTPDILYKSFDMNAFIWYCLVKGTTINQIEINHMMWDSRLFAKRKHGLERVNISSNQGTSWNEWYNSKSEDGGEFTYNNKSLTEDSSLYPILQIRKNGDNLYGLNITFPAQRYFKPKVRKKESENPNPSLCFNSSIYKFNDDYLKSIEILKPKIMLAGLINYMLGSAMSAANSLDVSFTKKIIETKLSTAIKNIIEIDDMEVEDCYVTFSNEEFDKMLEEMLLNRYFSTYYGGETNKIKKHDIESYISLIDSFNNSTTKEESISKVTRLVNNVLVAPGEEGSINYGIDANLDFKLLEAIIWAITMPIMESLFTPQVLLLLVINMRLMGIVNIDDFANNDLTKIINLLLNKILGLTKSIVRYIKDKIIELLLKLFLQKITPLLVKTTIALNTEKLQDWLLLLEAALNCLPKFKFDKTKIKGGIDDVNYADIYNSANIENYTNENQSSIPESASLC